MFEPLLPASGSSRRTRRRLAALPAAVTLHALALGGVGLAQLWAVEELPTPPEAMSPVLLVALAPPPPPPPPPRATGDRPLRPATGPVQPSAVPEGAPADTGTDRAADAEGAEGGVEGGIDRGMRDGVAGSVPETTVAPPDDGAMVYRVGGPVTAPVLVHRVLPEYPEAARRARLSGVVVVEAVIASDGTVADAQVVSDTTRFGGCAEAALRAVRVWRYRPALLDGRPVAVRMTLTITFSLV